MAAPVVGSQPGPLSPGSPESVIKKFEKISERRLKYRRCRATPLAHSASVPRRPSFSVAASRSRSGRAPWDYCAFW